MLLKKCSLAWFCFILIVAVMATTGCAEPSTPAENIGSQAFTEIWVNGNTDAADTLFAAEYTGFFVGIGSLSGPEGEVAGLATYQEALPDLAYTVEEIATTNDKTAVVWQAQGTHRGELFGFPATNEQLEIVGVTVYRVTDDQIIEGWHYWHTPGLLFQIGVLSPDVFEEERIEEIAEAMQAAGAGGHDLVGLEEALTNPNREFDEEESARLQAQAEFLGHVCQEDGAFVPETTLAFFDEDFVEHADFPQRQFIDLSEAAAIAKLFQMELVTFPTVLKVEDIFAFDDLVVVQSTLDMTQQVEFMGIPPDERSIISQRVDISRISSDGLIVEHWSGEDLTMYRQLGLVQGRE